MMKNYMIFFCLIGLTLLLASPAYARSIEKTPELFAEKHFKKIVLDHVEGEDDPGLYHLTLSHDISFGPLHRVHIASSTCFSTKETCTFVPVEEYVSAVIQDGKPVNVIGTYEQEPNAYAFSSFGYGTELAAVLAEVASPLVYFGPADAWFEVDDQKVRALTTSAQQFIGGEVIPLKSYSKILQEYQASINGTAEEGMSDGFGTSEIANVDAMSKSHDRETLGTFRPLGFVLLGSVLIGSVIAWRRIYL